MSTELVKSETAETRGHDQHSALDDFSNMLADANLDEHAIEIMKTLGGIDQILNEYVRICRNYENEELLNSEQIQHISDLMSNARTTTAQKQEQSHTIWDRMYSMAKLKDDTFHLSHSDTILHSMISNQHHADRLTAFLFSKYPVMALVIFVMPIAIVYFVDSSMWYHKWYVIMVVIVQIPVITYFVLLILSCNKPVFFLVISGFDFWIKMGYGVMAAVLFMIYFRKATDYSETQIIFTDIGSSTLILMIVMLSLMEGYAIKWSTAFALGFIVSLTITYNAIMYTLSPDQIGLENDMEIQLFAGFRFDVLELLGSALRVLSLFFWKQTLMTAYTRGDWCICIYLTPRIKWDTKTSADADLADTKHSIAGVVGSNLGA